MTQGDPLVYSTFIYLMEAMKAVIPGLEIEVVPGITSISAVPSATLVALCDGQERVAVLPATYGIEDLRQVLQLFDSVVLMKVSSVMPKVIQVLSDEGLLDKAVYVERATTDQQRIVWDLKSLKNDRCVYFSMVIINKKERSGALVDTSRLAATLGEMTK
jgi:precorrin-2/cobalt-factor-2 C20-methyltransferase